MQLLITRDKDFLLPLYAKKVEERDASDATYTDSGFDLFIPPGPGLKEAWVVPAGGSVKIPLGVVMVDYDSDMKSRPFYIYPRSSISKGPLRLANSVGIIDAGYRGELTIVLDNIANSPFLLYPGCRLVQVCRPGLLPFHVEFTKQVDDTKRGQDGFGSTGK